LVKRWDGHESLALTELSSAVVAFYRGSSCTLPCCMNVMLPDERVEAVEDLVLSNVERVVAEAVHDVCTWHPHPCHTRTKPHTQPHHPPPTARQSDGTGVWLTVEELEPIVDLLDLVRALIAQEVLRLQRDGKVHS